MIYKHTKDGSHRELKTEYPQWQNVIGWNTEDAIKKILKNPEWKVESDGLAYSKEAKVMSIWSHRINPRLYTDAKTKGRISYAIRDLKERGEFSKYIPSCVKIEVIFKTMYFYIRLVNLDHNT